MSWIRLCCGQSHAGPLCPDGLVMCQLCFERVPVDELWVVDGQPEDVCHECGEAEQAEIARRAAARDADA